MKREYGVELLDFYRGNLSARLLGVYVRQLSPDSSLVRALNGGRAPWSRVEHLLADLWVVLVKILNPKSRITDHPGRAQMEAERKSAMKSARVIELRAKFQKRKRAYGLE